MVQQSMEAKGYVLKHVESQEVYPSCYGLKPIIFEKKRLAQKFLKALKHADHYIIEEMSE